MAESTPSSGALVPMSASEQVLAQLGRQKWAIDARDADALKALYTADSAQVVGALGALGVTKTSMTSAKLLLAELGA